MTPKAGAGFHKQGLHHIRGAQGNPIRLILLLAQQIVQMEQRPPITLALLAGKFPCLYLQGRCLALSVLLGYLT